MLKGQKNRPLDPADGFLPFCSFCTHFLPAVSSSVYYSESDYLL